MGVFNDLMRTVIQYRKTALLFYFEQYNKPRFLPISFE